MTLDLLTIDCWDTILADGSTLDDNIFERLVVTLLAEYPTCTRTEIAAAFALEDRCFTHSLRTQWHTPPPQERLVTLLDFMNISRPSDGKVTEMVSQIDRAISTDWPELLPGAADLLRRARSSGLAMCLISNSAWLSPEAIIMALEHYQIVDAFSGFFFSCQSGHAKPDPEMFRIALRHFDCDPTNAVHVGDNPATDGVGAMKAGIPSLIIRQSSSIDSEIAENTEFVDSVGEVWERLCVRYELGPSR